MFDTFWGFFLVPIGLGLLGFIEPCSIGASLLFLKSVEGNPPAVRTMQAIVFTITRALFIGALGAGAALVSALHSFNFNAAATCCWALCTSRWD